jgi:hypothetical protein
VKAKTSVTGIVKTVPLGPNTSTADADLRNRVLIDILPINHQQDFSGPASRHGSLTPLFRQPYI